MPYSGQSAPYSAGEEITKQKLAFTETQQTSELFQTDFSDGTPGGGVNNTAENNVDWDIDTTKGNGNLFSLRCLLGANANYSSEIDYTFTATEAVTKITFDYQQMLEGHPWDALSVYVDGVELFHGENTGTGPSDWTAAEIQAFGTGSHVLRFKGYTDGSVFNSPDTIWVDNLKIESIVATFVPTADSIFKGFSTFEKTACLKQDLRVEGKSYLNDLGVINPVTTFTGSISSDFTGDEVGAKNYAFESQYGKTLAAGKTFNTVTGCYVISTDTVTNSKTQHLLGVRNTETEYTGASIAWDNATDGIPYSYLALKRDNKTNVYLSAMPKDKGASAIGSRLQIGHDQWTPDQSNNNTLDVNGNVEVSDDIEISGYSNGLILKTPDGSKRYKISIDNSGNVISNLQ